MDHNVQSDLGKVADQCDGLASKELFADDDHQPNEDNATAHSNASLRVRQLGLLGHDRIPARGPVH
eukprot:scaffold106_cov380-Prasinococcus_capsulatus_cf.AAC.54